MYVISFMKPNAYLLEQNHQVTGVAKAVLYTMLMEMLTY